jgi:uncharacterized protein (UPF0332 family)
MIDDLLQIAEDLATRESGRPKHTSLRRAVSTAYYALFHAIAERCAATLITYGGSDWETYTLVYRALDHATVKKVLSQDPSGKVFGLQIASIGAVFLQLQEARITADYDPGPFDYGKSEVLELIAQARNASQLMRALPEETSRRLAAHFIAKRR